MIYKYTTCESVIAKIMADSNMPEKEMRVTDIREWIFEAVEKIGAPMQYIDRESGADGCPILKIHDRQIPIPSDLVHLTAVAYSNSKNGQWIAARTDNSNFRQTGVFPKYKFINRDYYNQYEVPCIHEEEHEHFINKPITHQCQLYDINGMKYAERYIRHDEDVTFFVKPGWIVLNRDKGYVKLQYKAVATDKKGYPLIPDTQSYQEAIYWYVMMKLNFPKFMSGKLGGKGVNSSQNVYFYIQQQWNFYRNQAYAEAMMPTESDMRSIKNEWNKLIPDYDSDETFFKAEGSKQLNYTDYYYGY